MAKTTRNEMLRDDSRFYVVHPLDDVAEEKRSGEDLGPIHMTRSVKLSLLALRGYLIVMAMLVLYHVLGLARVI
jgi:hypothetical protein